jgi:hypothetical protein
MRINVGTVLKERYEILAQIGEGGFASVYRGRDLQLEREIAVKVLRLLPDGDSLSRFQREAKLLGQLSHRNIVSVYAYGLLDGAVPFIVMEHLRGKSLQSLLVELGRLDFQQTLTILSQCCEGLAYAHKAGVVHRDLSPANIFVEGDLGDPAVKLLDFGLSRLLSGEAGQCATLTETGVLIGNPPYMSPELARGLRVDLRSDIYSLGCVLYYCICGVQAFSAGPAVDYVYLQQSRYPREPVFDWKDAENEQLIKSVALRCLQKDPDKRFQSCDEILQALTTNDPQRRRAIESELEPWSGSQKGKKGTFSGTTKLRLSLASLILIVLMLLLSPPYVAVYLFGSLPEIAQAAFAVPEQALAEYLEQSSSTFGFSDRGAKITALQKIFLRLSEVYAANRLYERAASCSLSVAGICLQEGDKRGFAAAMSQVLNSTKCCANSRDKATLLLSCWKLIQNALSSKSAKYVSNDFLDLQTEVFDQMLSCKLIARNELQRCFDIIMNGHRIFEGLNADTTKAIAESTLKFLTEIKPKLRESESQALRILAGNCGTNAERLWRARLSIRHESGERTSDLKFGLAQCLVSTRRDEAFKLLSECRNDETADIWRIASTWDLEAAARLNLNHDYPGALQCSEQGLKVLEQVPLIVYRKSRSTKLTLTTTRIRALFKLGRQEEMALATDEMMKALWAKTPDIEAAVTHVDYGEEALSENPKGGHYTVKELIPEFQMFYWLPCQLCLCETNQKPPDIKALSYLLARLRQDRWQLIPPVRTCLDSELALVADPEIASLIRQILNEGKH